MDGVCFPEARISWALPTDHEPAGHTVVQFQTPTVTGPKLIWRQWIDYQQNFRAIAIMTVILDLHFMKTMHLD